MELSNEFVVALGVDETWKLLTDVERIAPCMPGAELQEIEGDEYRGVVKVKVGPITAQYKGKATFVEMDNAGHRAVLRAEGRDTRGQGNANATIVATLLPEDDGTRVSVVTDLSITGRAAQFGRGVMADVSTKLLGQFVTCLEKNVLGSGGAGAAPGAEAASASEPARAEVGAGSSAAAAGGGAAPATQAGPGGASDAALAGAPTGSNGSRSEQAGAASGPRTIVSRPAEPVDLLGTAGSPVLKRLLPALLGALAVFLLGRRLRRRRQG